MTTVKIPSRRAPARAGKHEPRARGAADGDATRQRLIEVALDHFGRRGFEATSTRTIAQQARANISAILYHFGGKHGLYIAVAEHIADFIGSRVAPLRIQIETALANGSVDADGAVRLVEAAVARMTALMAEPQTEAFARFIVREQQEPTEAFVVIYERMMGVMLPLLRRLVAIATHDDPASESAGVRTFAIVGQLLVFRVARAAVLRQMVWQEVGPSQVQAIIATVQRSARAMLLSARAENTT